MSIELLGVALLAGVNALASGETLASCANDQHNGVSYAVCRFNQSDDIRLFLNDPDGAPYSDFDAVNEALSAVDKALVFAMNAGMYHEDRTPVGLYVEASEEIAPANTNDGPGNFHLKPNGIFIIDKHGAWVTTTTAYQASNRTPPIYATQSGPMLVIDGDIHPRFLPDSDSRKRRNGVGVTDGGDVVFVLADAPVNLYGFASYFREVLGARNALYLDGSISRLFAPELDRNDPGAAMGPIVGVVEKQR